MRRRRKISVVNVTLSVMLVMTLILSVIHYFTKENAVNIPEDMTAIPKVHYENIIDDDGRYRYEDKDFRSSFGIDISEYQDNIDWVKLKEAGVEFVYMRIGRRGASTGILYMDDNFEDNYRNAKENGIVIGVYFFSQAASTDEAREEARFVANLLKHKEIDLPVVYDLEEAYLVDETPRIEGLGGKEFTDNALAFCKEIEKAGYEAMIYANQYWAEDLYDMERLTDYPIWFAQYGTDIPTLERPICIWQYTNKGRIDGIDHDVDFDIMFIVK